MKTMTKIPPVLLIIFLFCVSLSTTVDADVDWTMLKEIQIEARPLDVAASPDGNTIFLLTPGEILVYSASKSKIANRIPVSADFDRIAVSANGETLILTGGSSRLLKLIRIDRIFAIDITGLPFDGPEDAPVTIAAFDDYQ
jgi:hypothetical protein